MPFSQHTLWCMARGSEVNHTLSLLWSLKWTSCSVCESILNGKGGQPVVKSTTPPCPSCDQINCSDHISCRSCQERNSAENLACDNCLKQRVLCIGCIRVVLYYWATEDMVKFLHNTLLSTPHVGLITILACVNLNFCIRGFLQYFVHIQCHNIVQLKVNCYFNTTFCCLNCKLHVVTFSVSCHHCMCGITY